MNQAIDTNTSISIFADKATSKILAKKHWPELFAKNNASIFLYNQSYAIEQSILKNSSKPLVLAVSDEKELQRINDASVSLDTDNILIMWCGNEITPRRKNISVFCVDQLYFKENFDWDVLCRSAQQALEAQNLERMFRL